MKIRLLGLVPYESVYQSMLDFCANRVSDQEDEIWVLEHEPVYTLGRAANPSHLLFPSKNQSIPVISSNRGGQVTYHGPGQIIVYFLIDLARKHWGIRDLVNYAEDLSLAVLKTYGIQGERLSGKPGVYVNGKKIASLGFRITKGYSMHGLSFNVAMDLSPFFGINPCGYAGLQMTQLKDEVPGVQWNEVEQVFLKKLKSDFSEK